MFMVLGNEMDINTRQNTLCVYDGVRFQSLKVLWVVEKLPLTRESHVGPQLCDHPEQSHRFAKCLERLYSAVENPGVEPAAEIQSSEHTLQSFSTLYKDANDNIGHTWIPSTFSLAHPNAQSCLTLQPHGLQPARFLCPWISPGKNTGGGLPFPPPGDLPDSGIKPRSPASSPLAGRFFTTE